MKLILFAILPDREGNRKGGGRELLVRLEKITNDQFDYTAAHWKTYLFQFFYNGRFGEQFSVEIVSHVKITNFVHKSPL